MNAQDQEEGLPQVRGDGVLLVDDDGEFLKRLCRSLARAGFSRVLVASDAATAEKIAGAHHPRVALIDLNLGDDTRSGFSLLKQVRADHPSMLPVILSGNRSPQHFFRAARLGAVDYLVKGPLLDVPREVGRILDGERGAVAGRPLPEIRSDLDYLRLLGLTLKEVQTVTNLAQGFSEPVDRADREITDRGLERICAKLGLNNAQHLVRSLAVYEVFLDGNRAVVRP